MPPRPSFTINLVGRMDRSFNRG